MSVNDFEKMDLTALPARWREAVERIAEQNGVSAAALIIECIGSAARSSFVTESAQAVLCRLEQGVGV